MSEDDNTPRNRFRKARELAIFLPALGAVLVFIPLLWHRGAAGMQTSSAAIYLFAIWLLSIIAAALVARLVLGDREER